MRFFARLLVLFCAHRKTLNQMKRASLATLQQLEPLLVRVRGLAGLVERKPGMFYRRSSAFLHFHEDAAGIFADVKLNGAEFERLPVSSVRQRAVFWRALSSALRASQS
jgi:hypothetical protein